MVKLCVHTPSFLMPEHAYNENDSRVCLSGGNRYDATDFVLSIEGIIIQLVRTYVRT